jgi:hypothetical protein
MIPTFSMWLKPKEANPLFALSRGFHLALTSTGCEASLRIFCWGKKVARILST